MNTMLALAAVTTTTHTVIPEECRCACGCGGVTGRTFVQGHDAKLHSMAKKNPGRVPTAAKTVEYLLVAPWMTPEMWYAIAEAAE